MEKDELIKKLRLGKLKCFKCDRTATDIHHLDNDHSNDSEGNLAPICKICHNEIHGITPQIDELGALVRNFYRVQEFRKAVDNQIRSYEAIGYSTEIFSDLKINVEEMEGMLNKQIKTLAKEHVFWKEAKKVKGVSHLLFANLVSEIQDPRRFANPSKLWKYFGLHTVEGSAPKRTRGNMLGFSVRRRSLMWKFADQFNRNRNRGNMGKLLAEYHEFYKERDKNLSKGHILNRAKRKAAKVFLTCFWSRWMEILGEKPTKPFAFDKLEHKNIIEWKDIIN